MINNANPSQGKFTILDFNTVLHFPSPKQLVSGLLYETSLSAIVGASNTGKTFLSLDLGLHVALGKSWFGRCVEQCSVVYIAAEGGVGIQKRLAAFKAYHGISNTIPFFIIKDAPNLLDVNETNALVDELKKVSGLGLVIIDTLNRTIGGKDENSGEIMGPYIAAADFIRREAGCHVLTVHHTGKDPDRGARGHSSFTGNIDTEISLTYKKDAGRSISTPKQRDMERVASLPFELKAVDLGLDMQGNQLSSCVVIPALVSLSGATIMKPKKASQLSIVRHAISLGMEFDTGIPPVLRPAIEMKDLIDLFVQEKFVKSDQPQSIRKAVVRFLEYMVKNGELCSDGRFIWLPDRQDNSGQV